MKVSPLEEYGLRCLLCLAREAETTWGIEAIARREGLSKAYVAKIVMLLRRAGLVESTRGRLGGIRLSLAPQDISVARVLEALDGPLYRATVCQDFAHGLTCDLSYCSIRGLWEEVASSVNRVLETRTLRDLLRCEGSGSSKGSACASTLPSGVASGAPHGDDRTGFDAKRCDSEK
jgi:Rrf2 family protein